MDFLLLSLEKMLQDLKTSQGFLQDLCKRRLLSMLGLDILCQNTTRATEWIPLSPTVESHLKAMATRARDIAAGRKPCLGCEQTGGGGLRVYQLNRPQNLGQNRGQAPKFETRWMTKQVLSQQTTEKQVCMADPAQISDMLNFGCLCHCPIGSVSVP